MEIISLLKDTKCSTLNYFDFGEEDLFKSYEEAKWSVRQILIHLADAEAILHERIKRVICEPRQVIWAFDQDKFCEGLNYQNFPLEISKSMYVANRNSILFLAERYYINCGNKEFIHSETGVRTLKDEFDKVGLHNQHHLAQIANALKLQ